MTNIEGPSSGGAQPLGVLHNVEQNRGMPQLSLAAKHVVKVVSNRFAQEAVEVAKNTTKLAMKVTRVMIK